jgi:cardiolipin synthase
MVKSFNRFAATATSLAVGASLLASCGVASRLSGPQVAGNSFAAAGLHRASAAHGASAVSLVVLPDMGVAPLVDALKGAKKSIKLEMYMLTTSKAAGEILQTLIERHKAGVNVQVMLETQPYMPAQPPKCQTGTFNPNTPAITALVAGGVPLKYTSPRFKYTHAKSMIIDGETAFIMSANMTNSAYTINRDYIVIDHNRAEVADVQQIFDTDWVGGNFTPKSPNLVVSPVNSRSKMLSLIDNAQKSLVIQTEFFSDPEIAKHLAARVKAGVDITVMLSFQGQDKCTGSNMNDDELKALNDIGITKVAFVRSVVMHAKAIIADGHRAFIGSENMSANSLDNNREVGILMDDPGVIAQLTAVTSKDWNSRTIVTPAPPTDTLDMGEMESQVESSAI